MNEITIGYLSWKRHNILEQTLSSHLNNGLFDIIEPKNRLIFFQEISDKDINIANKYECNYFGESSNIGILDGFINLVEKCKTEYFIFSENDWLLIENKEVTYKILEDCIELLSKNKSDIVKLRSSNNPGKPLYSMPTDVENWKNQNIDGFPYKLESLSWLDEPNKVYNNKLEEFNNNYKWYITTLDNQRWSNNIFIAKTNYLKNIILPLISIFSKNNHKYLGLEEILINYNDQLGKYSDLDNIINLYSGLKISAGIGLFMHKDFI